MYVYILSQTIVMTASQPIVVAALLILLSYFILFV